MFVSNSRALRAIKFVLLFQDKSLTERVFFYERRMTMNLISYSFKLHLAMILKVFSSSYEKLFSFCQFFFLLSSSNFQTANVKLRHSDWTTISSASEIMVSRKLWKRKRLFESNFWWYRKFRVLREKLMKHLKRKLVTMNLIRTFVSCGSRRCFVTQHKSSKSREIKSTSVATFLSDISVGEQQETRSCLSFKSFLMRIS